MSEPRQGWLDIREVGTVWGIRFVAWLCTGVGRTAARLFLRVLAIYYVATHRVAREASAAYWRRLGQEPTRRRMADHIYHFAVVATDRFLFLTKRTQSFEITTSGSENLAALRSSGKGGILLGAHLGSFQAMSAVASTEQLRLRIVGDFSNAERINGVLRTFNPTAEARVIQVSDGVDFVIAIKEAIEAGELVGILGDRLRSNDAWELADFLGSQAPFPTGPYALASVLQCPIYLTFGLYHEPNRYDLYCEPFAEGVRIPRAERSKVFQEQVQQFADRLSYYTRLAPNNWFNFFDFWSPP
jgi:predicted LPLAT superfamily acyltransferase